MPDRHTLFVQAVAALSRKHVLVGIPLENDPRPGSPIGNAAIGYIHRILARRRRHPTQTAYASGGPGGAGQVNKRLAAAAQAVLEGNQAKAIQHMGQAGQAAVNSIKKTIQAGLQPPLQPMTVVNHVTGQARRQRKAARRGVSLIETGAQRSLTAASSR